MWLCGGFVFLGRHRGQRGGDKGGPAGLGCLTCGCPIVMPFFIYHLTRILVGRTVRLFNEYPGK